jgi:hypothetical protein
MKFKLFSTNGKFYPQFKFGKIMWTDNSGNDQYELEYHINITKSTFTSCHRLYLYPGLFFYPLHKGILSSCDDLGIVTNSIGIGVEFWKSYAAVSILKIQHTKTQQEIDETTKKKK